VVKLFFVAFIASVMVAQPLSAQSDSRETVNQSIAWFAWTSNIKVSDRLSLLVDGQFRQARKMEPQQYQFRTGLEVKINNHIQIMPLAYVYTWNYLYGKQPATFRNNEHRIFQQIVVKHAIRRISFEHRARIEQRFIQHHSQNQMGDVIDDGYSVNQNRIRYRLMAKFPINREKIEAGTYFGAIYDEVFISWGENITYHRPDQNRIFAGIGYQFDKNFSIQAGPIYQMLIKSNGAMQENNIGTLIQFAYNIDLTKQD
jgi:Protein of unknown function (DUF2490)